METGLIPARFVAINHIAAAPNYSHQDLAVTGSDSTFQAKANDEDRSKALDGLDIDNETDGFTEGVYHINAGGGSFTTGNVEPLPKSSFRTIFDYVNDQPKHIVTQDPHPGDLVLQQRMQVVAKLLLAAGHIDLSRAQVDMPDCCCAYPKCTFMKRSIWGGQLYLQLTLADPRIVALTFHLICLEKLWNGEDFQGRLPVPALYVETHCDEEVQPKDAHLSTAAEQAAAVFHLPQESSATTLSEQADSKHSTSIPTRRFQHLAEFITPDTNLSKYEKRYLVSWKQFSTRLIELDTASRRLERWQQGGSSSSCNIEMERQHLMKEVHKLRENSAVQCTHALATDLSEMLELSL